MSMSSCGCGGVDHPAADFGGGGIQGGYVFDIQRRQTVEDPLMQGVVGDEVLERLGGGGEAARYRHPEPGQMAIISPREEFLPPTRARSDSRSACGQRMLSFKA